MCVNTDTSIISVMPGQGRGGGLLAGLGVNIHLLMMSLTTCYALHLEYEPLSKVLWVHGIQKCGMDYFFTCLVLSILHPVIEKKNMPVV